MLSVFNSLIPVILTILLGFVLKRGTLFSDASWTGFENLCYYILFPALLIKTLATAQLGSSQVMLFSGMVLFAIIAMSLLLLLLYPIMTRGYSVKPTAYASLFQGATRWHSFIALSITGYLYGDEGVAYMAITMAVIIPPLNVINVAFLAHTSEGETNWSDVLLKLVTNPFIIACLIGALLNISGFGLPVPIYSVFELLGGGALGLGLLTVGAGLHLSRIRDQRVLVALGSGIRLLGMPMLMFTAAWLFGIEGIPRTIAVIAAAVPTASSGYVLARLMGADATLMANLITVQVIVSAATLPLMIWLSGV